MKVLVFDTETTGLPQSRVISQDTIHKWPHIVQFSYIIYDTELNDITVSVDNIVKVSEGVDITPESQLFHGITNEMSQNSGKNMADLLKQFFYHLRESDILVGHNVSFDINMLKVELLRMILQNENPTELKENKFDLHYLTHYENVCCTMKESVTICALEKKDKSGKSYNKFPKLTELHETLFKSTPNNLHNSFNDILVTLRCYVKLKYDVDLNNTCDTFIKCSSQIGLL